MSLRVEGLSFTYPGFAPTLRELDLDVAAGTSAFLLGPSGIGKSTLLRCLAGLEAPQAGHVLVAGRDVSREPPHRRRIGLLFQEPALFPHLNAWQNVAFPLRHRAAPISRADEPAEARRLLDLVQIPAARHDAAVDELSGGQRARVALARALAAQPLALLLDEPFASLDRDLRDTLGPLVKRLLADAGIPALWVTHDRDEAFRLGDTVWELRDGRLADASRTTPAPPT